MFTRVLRSLSCLVLAVVLSAAAPAHILDTTTPVNFSADDVAHDDQNQTVTATGHVELVQGARILRADSMVYYLSEDRVTAKGNVSLMDEKGDVSFADQVELKSGMKDGFVKGLLSLLENGARFTASEAVRTEGGKKTTMTDATYTACKVCEADPHPLWQIKAAKVVHDQEKQTVRYNDAQFDVLGVPVAWTPYFSHPDPTLKRKSGFLLPDYGWSQNLGTHVDVGYYYTLSPDKDLTLRVEPTALAGTVFKGEWRQRFEHGQMQINGTTVNSDRTEEDGSISQGRQRGSLFASGLFDLTDTWRAGFDAQRVSDKQYLGFYDLYPNQDDKEWGYRSNGVLTSQAYAERLAGRDYARVTVMDFQDIRLGIRDDQPAVLPMAETRMLGDPGALWGGRWEAEASALGLTRNSEDQNVARASVGLGWERQGRSASGFSNLLRFSARGDGYNVRNNSAAPADPAAQEDPSTLRGNATASFVTSYPLIKRMEKSQVIVEPVAGVSLSPDISQKSANVPNEDSADLPFDTDNLFDDTRYAGLDREEAGGRANYGMRFGLYGDSGRYGKVFLGQSRRLYGDETEPLDSGLGGQSSDYVGQLKLGLSKYVDADYRLQADSDTLKVRRHELQARVGNDTVEADARYMYSAPMPSLGFLDTRQQVRLDGSYRFSKNWSWHGLGLYDFGGEPGFRNATTGVEYTNECFSFSLLGSRNVADIASGENETKLMFRLGFRGLGEIAGPELYQSRTTPR